MKRKEKSTKRQLKRYKSSSEGKHSTKLKTKKKKWHKRNSSEDKRDKKQKICQGLFNFFIRFDDIANTYWISFFSYFFVNNLGSDENNIKNYFTWTQYELQKNV